MLKVVPNSSIVLKASHSLQSTYYHKPRRPSSRLTLTLLSTKPAITSQSQGLMHGPQASTKFTASWQEARRCK